MNNVMWDRNVGIVRQEDMMFHQQAELTHEELIAFLPDGVVANAFADLITQQTRDLFGDIMSHIGIPRLCCAADVMELIDGNYSPTSSTLHFLCTFVPFAEGKASIQNRNQQYPDHPRYWSNQLQWRKDKQTFRDFSFIELALYIHPCFLTDEQKRRHAAAFANNIGPVIQPSSLKFTAYKNYSAVLICILDNPLVKFASLNGWQPLFLCKNLLATADFQFGINRVKLTTCDRQNRSYIALAGFFKRLGDNEYVAMSITNMGSPIVANIAQFVSLEE